MSNESQYIQKWKELCSHIQSQFGFEDKYLKNHILPRWWTRSMLSDEIGFQESVQALASSLQIDPIRLLNLEAPLVTANLSARCKGTKIEDIEKQSTARKAAEALARNLISVCSEEDATPVLSAIECRERLRSNGGVISLRSLCILCWHLGVPVAHLAEAPKNKPHAIAVNCRGRYAIVLLRNNKHRGWHLFDVAHELGHIMLGHVKSGETFVDSESTDVNAQEELDANQFALELLTGQPQPIVLNDVVKADTLRRKAEVASKRYCVDPQWLIVSAAYHWPKKFFGVAGKALNDGWPNDDGRLTVYEVMAGELRRLEVSRAVQQRILSFTTVAEKAA